MPEILSVLDRSLRMLIAIALAFVIPLGTAILFTMVARLLFLPYSYAFYLGGAIGAFLGYVVIEPIV